MTLANLFASYSENPRVNERVRARIQSVPAAHALEPMPGWVVGVTPLPGCTPVRQAPGHPECFFAEGMDRLSSADLDRLCELAATSPERIAEVPGDWGFCRLEPRGRVLVVRSCGGKVPFYIWDTKQTRGFSTLMGDVVRWRDEEPELDPLVNAIMLSWFPAAPDDRSLLTGVRLVRRGHFAVVGCRDRPRQRSYWDPRDRPPPRAMGRVPDALAEAFRADLIETLERELEPGGHHLATLSGGVDSSALVHLAAGTLGRRISTISFVPSTESVRRREIDYIDRVTGPLSIRPAFRFQIDPAMRIELARNSPPVAVHMMNPGLASLHRVTRQGAFATLMGGEYADNLCGSALSQRDWRQSVPFSRTLRLGELPFGRREPIRWLRQRRLDLRGQQPHLRPLRLPFLVRPGLNEEYQEWLIRRRSTILALRCPWRRMHASLTEDDYSVAMHWEVTSWHGLRRVTPFMTRCTIEIGYSVHPDDLVGPGTKRLLRRALHGDVPAANLYRGDKGGWETPPDNPSGDPWRVRIPSVLEPIVRDEWVPHPPARLAWQEAARLWQLLNFASAVRDTRSDARARAPSVLAERQPDVRA